MKCKNMLFFLWLLLLKSIQIYCNTIEERQRVFVGEKALPFCAKAVIDSEVKEISLNDFQDRYKVIFFYPLDFTFVCPTEILAFQEKLPEFEALNTQIIGISVDSVYAHSAWLNMPRTEGGIKGVTFPLVSDIHRVISRDYGVLCEKEGIALRGVFILDRENIVQSIHVNNLPLGRNVDEIIRLIKALQHIEISGNVCPVNWQENTDSFTATHEGLLSYINKKYMDKTI